jgi:hypothetical protein
MPTFFASSTIAFKTSISACGGAGSGVRPISPVCLMPHLRESLDGHARFERDLPQRDCSRGDHAGPLYSPDSILCTSALWPAIG